MYISGPAPGLLIVVRQLRQQILEAERALPAGGVLRVHIHIHIHIHMHIHIHICIHMCIYVCIYIYIYIVGGKYYA